MAKTIRDKDIIYLFMDTFELKKDLSENIYDEGYRSINDLASAKNKELAKVKGIGVKTANRIIKIATNINKSTKSNSEGKKGSQDLAKWLSGDAGDDALSSWLGDEADMTAKPSSIQTAGSESDDSLKAWLSGEKDTLAEWLGDSDAEPEAVEPGEAQISPEMGKALEEREQALTEREKELEAQQAEIEDLKLELETLKNKLSQSIDGDSRVDPLKLMEENAELTKKLQHEIRLKKTMEDEIDKVKKGSVAVIKYMKAQKSKESRNEVTKLQKKLVEEIAMRKKIAIALSQKAEENKTIKEQLSGKLSELPDDERVLKEKELKLAEYKTRLEAKEKELKLLEESLKTQETIEHRADSTDSELQERLAAELREKEQVWLEREEDFKRQLREMEEEVSTLKIEGKLLKDSSNLRGKDEGEVSEILDRKAKELESKEKSLLLREEEIRRLTDLVKEKDSEIAKMREPMKYKEEELNRREEDLMYREKRYQAEIQKLEQVRKETGGDEHSYELKKKLEELNQQIRIKEEEVRNKEKYLTSKMEELRLREQGIIEEEIGARDEDRHIEWRQEKVKSGTPRLDDLLLGGIPFGSNVMLYGDSFSGKEILVNSFVAEGLKKGVPVIWVITNKTAPDIREEMAFIISGYEEYEKLGLVKYIDTYSRTLGETAEEEHVIYLDEQTDHEGLLTAVNQASEEFLQQHKYYRLAFRSISTLVSYLDPNTVFRFLTPFGGRRKRERAVSFFTIEKGMHSDQEIQMIGSTMDGAIDFKVEQLNTMLAVKGICDVQSRSYVRYEASKQGISIGSFSLDHIR